MIKLSPWLAFWSFRDISSSAFKLGGGGGGGGRRTLQFATYGLVTWSSVRSIRTHRESLIIAQLSMESNNNGINEMVESNALYIPKLKKERKGILVEDEKNGIEHRISKD